MFDDPFTAEKVWFDPRAWCAVFGIFAIIGLFILPFIGKKIENTKKIVKKCAKSGISQNDAWDQPIKIDIKQLEDRKITTAISAGGDGEFGTKDDISFESIDRNKSMILGKKSIGAVKWSFEKSKEFLKGVKSELKKDESEK